MLSSLTLLEPIRSHPIKMNDGRRISGFCTQRAVWTTGLDSFRTTEEKVSCGYQSDWFLITSHAGNQSTGRESCPGRLGQIFRAGHFGNRMLH